MQLVMRRRMRDQLAFLKGLDVRQAGGQPDMKKVYCERGQAEEREHEKRRDDHDAALEYWDAVHRSAPRNHEPVDHQPEQRIENEQHREKENRAARKEL